MNRLVSRRPARRAPRTVVARHTPRGDLHFVGKIDNLLQRGHLVMVSRCGCSGFVSVTRNGPMFLVRNIVDEPIGSYATLSQAIAALDRYDEDDQGRDGDTGSAA